MDMMRASRSGPTIALAWLAILLLPVALLRAAERAQASQHQRGDPRSCGQWSRPLTQAKGPRVRERSSRAAMHFAPPEPSLPQS
jgi:hypothetical protein